MHSNSHLGLSLLAMTHVAAATPNLTYAADTHYPWQDAADEILEGGRVPIIDGKVSVPTAPGLGANLDQDALARGKERYERCSYRERDDRTPMRARVDPAWEFKLARW
jgi:glucarate dehydratase